ncbi:MAG: hypothetical protein J4428_02445 [Candidatus Aenigmarchaeota archaeon]|nr:hypothetical protein [Candidatus Aenigmarchaeota archaeon]
MLLNEEKFIDLASEYLTIVKGNKHGASLNNLSLNNIINISGSEIESFSDKLSEKANI